MGEIVEFPSNGATGGGYLAPASAGAGPGVVVIQEWWGLVEHITDVCDRFSAEGFTALAPDLYHGRTVPPGEPDEARKAMMSLDMERAATDMSGAIDHLLRHPQVRGDAVGVVGFCFGGGLALWLATLRGDDVAAAVAFYGLVPPDAPRPDYARISAAVQGHYAEADAMAGPEAMQALDEELTALGTDVQMHLYPGTSHAFFNDTRPEVHDSDAAHLAWVRTLEFLRAKLG